MSDLPCLYADLLNQPKAAVQNWWLSKAMVVLKAQARNAFEGFVYLAYFATFLHNMQFANTTDYTLWYQGLVGSHAQRSRDDVRAINRLADAQESNQAI